MANDLGELKSVELRTAWPNEAQDFTPWLAAPENIERLGDALGLELQVEGTEVPVGPYWADILARNVGTDRLVVIENQLGKTDHDHLGKGITYAAVLGATTVVWVAANFSDEHRKALDWLNDNTTDEVALFGVQVELWSIDGSRPAVRFNIVSHPADIGHPPIKGGEGELTEVRKLQLEWWTAVRDQLLKRHVLASAQSPAGKYWYNISLGRTGYHLSCLANTWENHIGVRVYMRGKYGADAALEQLLAMKDDIEREVGEPLTWNPHPEKQDKTIVVHRPADLSDKTSWPAHLDWMTEMVAKLRKTFAPRVKALDLCAGGNGEEPEA